MSPDELAEHVGVRMPDVVKARGEVTVVLGRDELLDGIAWLGEEPELELSFLASVTATDWPGQFPRYWVVYELMSPTRRHRLRVKVGLDEDDPHVPSVCGLFPSANWHERETYDFYGIVFDDHPDLSRILLPEDWEGYPLRKTEELGGVNTRFVGAFIPPVDKRTT